MTSGLRVNPVSALWRAPTIPSRSLNREHGWKLLLVEDDADSAEAVVALLSLHGIPTLWANSGGAAMQTLDSLQRLGECRPAFVLLDVNIPNTDTVKLGRELQAHPLGCPVVLISAASPQVLEQRAAEIGAVASLRKPFSMERLLEILHEQGLEDSGVNPRGEARR